MRWEVGWRLASVLLIALLSFTLTVAMAGELSESGTLRCILGYQDLSAAQLTLPVR